MVLVFIINRIIEVWDAIVIFVVAFWNHGYLAWFLQPFVHIHTLWLRIHFHTRCHIVTFLVITVGHHIVAKVPRHTGWRQGPVWFITAIFTTICGDGGDNGLLMGWIRQWCRALLAIFDLQDVLFLGGFSTTTPCFGHSVRVTTVQKECATILDDCKGWQWQQVPYVFDSISLLSSWNLCCRTQTTDSGKKTL